MLLLCDCLVEFTIALRVARIDAAEAWQAHSAAAASKDAWKPASFAAANSGYHAGSCRIAGGGGGGAVAAALDSAPLLATAAEDPLWNQLRGFRATPSAASISDAVAEAARDHNDVSVDLSPSVAAYPVATGTAVPAAMGAAVAAPFDPFSLPVAPGEGVVAAAVRRVTDCARTQSVRRSFYQKPCLQGVCLPPGHLGVSLRCSKQRFN